MASEILKIASFGCSQTNCSFSSENRQDFVIVLDANPPGLYCKKHSSFCQECQHSVALNSAVLSDGSAYCRSCYAKSKWNCERCNKIEYQGTVKRDGKDLCFNCANTCEICEKIDSEGVIKDRDDDYLCHDCFEEYWTKCPNCEKPILKNELMESKSRYNRNAPKQLGCDDCMATCISCKRVTDFKNSENIYKAPDNEYYCENCFHDSWIFCSECNEIISNEEAQYIENVGEMVCASCYGSNYGSCFSCGQEFPLNNLTEDAVTGHHFCDECWEGTEELPNEYQNLEPLGSISYSKYDRSLSKLRKLLPISIKDLKTKFPALADSLKDLIVFSKGKDLSKELVNNFHNSVPKQDYSVQFTTWRSQLQRSVKSEIPQLVLNIVAAPELIQKMKDDNSYFLFDKINITSKKSGHPMVQDQLGWVRLELHPEKKYILIDEIQTDHMNAIDRINTEQEDGVSYKSQIKNKLQLTEAQWQKICDNLKKHIKNFPDIALAAVFKLAQANGFTNIFYHTFESGKQLKHNAPPKSLYTELPKRHFFQETNQRPFGLEGKFLAREARKMQFRFLLKKAKLSQS